MFFFEIDPCLCTVTGCKVMLGSKSKDGVQGCWFDSGGKDLIVVNAMFLAMTLSNKLCSQPFAGGGITLPCNSNNTADINPLMKKAIYSWRRGSPVQENTPFVCGGMSLPPFHSKNNVIPHSPRQSQSIYEFTALKIIHMIGIQFRPSWINS